MIDHVSIGVRDLQRARRFYAAVLAAIGLTELRTWPAAVGFGKKYPEFWINHRPALAPADTGVHVCLRAPSPQAVDAFHAAALAEGGGSDGAPGPRPEYSDGYYAAFVTDPDGNRIEAVTFVGK
jgi:catechol 2,3-dioxygenase-like lactoylglutathione lyase family enzyme